jgi:ADP-ribose pyrophosphatase
MKKVVPSNSILVPEQAKKTYRGIMFDAYHWDQTLYDGSKQVYEMLKRQDTVSAICIVHDKIIVLDDEQPHSGKHLSFPGGRVEADDDSILDAAKREVLEETGYSFKYWRLIKVSQPSIEIEWFVYLMVATEITGKVEATPDAGEKINLNLMEFSQIKQLVVTQGGHIGHNRDIFETVETINELSNLPEFQGNNVDR